MEIVESFVDDTIQVVRFAQQPNVDELRKYAADAKQPCIQICGRPCYPKRRVLNFGKSYYYSGHAESAANTPEATDEFRTRVGLADFPQNQFLVNVYDKITDNIGPHMDKSNTLADPWVYSFSFALRPVVTRTSPFDSTPPKPAADAVLAYMQFRGPNVKLNIPIVDGMCVRFDAVEHRKRAILHSVPRHHFPRINLTMRTVRPFNHTAQT